MFVKKDDIQLVITFTGPGSIQIEAGKEYHEYVNKLVQEIADFLIEHNFYKGKNIRFSSSISFLDVGQMDWDSVVMDPDVKNSIRMHTTAFLKNYSQMKKYGIPCKRGIILAGDSGTGKTMICKALMSEADDITCIITDAYSMFEEEYISDLFSLAQDLSPSLVFIEDIDCIGQERRDFYHGSAPLIALLAEMDGIKERTQIVTIATSNHIETVDKALSERPSRFDQVFRLSRPDYQKRIEILKNLAGRIPISDSVMEYIAERTDGFTPAHLQEIANSMVISQIDKEGEVTEFSRQDVDVLVSQMNYECHNEGIGFTSVLQRNSSTRIE